MSTTCLTFIHLNNIDDILVYFNFNPSPLLTMALFTVILYDHVYFIDIDISKMKKLMKKVLTKNHAALTDLPKTSLVKLAEEMFSAGLINREVQRAPTLNDIIGEFQAGMSFKKDHTQLQEYAKMFLSVLNDMGGSFACASDVLRNEWTEIIKRELKVDINFTLN